MIGYDLCMSIGMGWKSCWFSWCLRYHLCNCWCISEFCTGEWLRTVIWRLQVVFDKSNMISFELFIRMFWVRKNELLEFKLILLVWRDKGWFRNFSWVLQPQYVVELRVLLMVRMDAPFGLGWCLWEYSSVFHQAPSDPGLLCQRFGWKSEVLF